MRDLLPLPTKDTTIYLLEWGLKAVERTKSRGIVASETALKSDLPFQSIKG